MVVPDFVRFYSMKAGNFPILQQKIYTGPKAAVAVKGFIHRTSVYYIGGFVAFAVYPPSGCCLSPSFSIKYLPVYKIKPPFKSYLYCSIFREVFKVLSRKSCGNFFIFVNIVNGYEHRAEYPANGISDCHGEKHIREHSAYRKEIYLTERIIFTLHTM